MAVLVSVVVFALLAWLFVLRPFRRDQNSERKSKYGFTVRAEEEQRNDYAECKALSESLLTQATEKSDSAIRDVLNDYRTAHSIDGTVFSVETSTTTYVWCLGNTGVVTCRVNYGCGIPAERLHDATSNDVTCRCGIEIRENAPEGRLLAETLQAAIRDSVSVPKVEEVKFRDIVNYPLF